MVISARFNSLTECCTWWLNSPANAGTMPSLQILIRRLKTQIALGLQMPYQVNSEKLQNAELNMIDGLHVCGQ